MVTGHQVIELAPGEYSVHLIGDVDGHPTEDLVDITVAKD
jgi:hypothetical protein